LTESLAASRGRPKASLKLISAELEQLQRWAWRPKSSQALALPYGISLACAARLNNKQVAAQCRWLAW